MARLCRSFDWDATVLGPPTGWTQSHRTIVSALLASRHPMFLWWGPDLVQVYNDAYRPSLCDRHPQALGARGRDFWTDIWEAIGPQIEQVMSGGSSTWFEDQFLPIQRNGRLEDVYWTYSYSAVRDDDGHIAGTLVVCQETTSRIMTDRRVREAEAQLAEQREQLLVESERARADAEVARAEAQRANRAKLDFLRIMSHELRTPLNAISGYAALLEMEVHGPINDAQRDDLLRIGSSQQHLLTLINEVLHFAKLESGSLQYDIESVPVEHAIQNAASMVTPQIRAKGVRLTLDCGVDGLAVLADRERLGQILINLLSNAMKFTPTGGTIAVLCYSAGDDALIEVADSGVGIAANMLETIFEPFVQERSDLTRTHEGTGLGLAISRDLARGMRGELRVKSEPGLGSTFQLSIPLATG
ncbi:MAG: ATP-binding protein [Longimicrobiales bacterium]